MGKNLKLVLNYLKRIVKDPFSVQSWSAMARYVVSGFQAVAEKMTGYDYTMVYFTKDEDGDDHSVYTKTPRYVVNRILSDVEKYMGGWKLHRRGVRQGIRCDRGLPFREV